MSIQIFPPLFCKSPKGTYLCSPNFRGVAQLASASALGAEGRRFESYYPDEDGRSKPPVLRWDDRGSSAPAGTSGSPGRAPASVARRAAGPEPTAAAVAGAPSQQPARPLMRAGAPFLQHIPPFLVNFFQDDIRRAECISLIMSSIVKLPMYFGTQVL